MRNPNPTRISQTFWLCLNPVDPLSHPISPGVPGARHLSVNMPWRPRMLLACLLQSIKNVWPLWNWRTILRSNHWRFPKSHDGLPQTSSYLVRTMGLFFSWNKPSSDSSGYPYDSGNHHTWMCQRVEYTMRKHPNFMALQQRTWGSSRRLAPQRFPGSTQHGSENKVNVAWFCMIMSKKNHYNTWFITFIIVYIYI